MLGFGSEVGAGAAAAQGGTRPGLCCRPLAPRRPRWRSEPGAAATGVSVRAETGGCRFSSAPQEVTGVLFVAVLCEITARGIAGSQPAVQDARGGGSGSGGRRLPQLVPLLASHSPRCAPGVCRPGELPFALKLFLSLSSKTYTVKLRKVKSV